MILRFASVACAVMTASLAVACAAPAKTQPAPTATTNGDDPSGGANDYHGTFTTISDPLADGVTYGQAVCQHMFTCDPITNLGTYESLDACAKLVDAAFEPIKSAPNTLVSWGLERCIADIGLADCTAQIDQLDDCHFVGEGPANSACAIDAECSSGACRFDSAALACGTCVAKGVEQGGDCSFNACDKGLTCNANTKICGYRLKTAEYDCRGIGCANATDRCIQGICSAVLAEDSVCALGPDATDDDPCPASQRCIADTCTDVHVTAKAGESCSSTTQCLNGMCGSDGICVANGAPGDPCGDLVSPPCANNVTCTADDRCVATAVPALAACN